MIDGRRVERSGRDAPQEIFCASPAAYDDYALACRRAASLARGFGIPFSVDLFGAEVASAGPTPSVAVAEPGYYAYTLADPRPNMLIISARAEEE